MQRSAAEKNFPRVQSTDPHIPSQLHPSRGPSEHTFPPLIVDKAPAPGIQLDIRGSGQLSASGKGRRTKARSPGGGVAAPREARPQPRK